VRNAVTREENVAERPSDIERVGDPR